MACSASFFSKNSVFFSQQFSRNSIFQPVLAKFQTSERGLGALLLVHGWMQAQATTHIDAATMECTPLGLRKISAFDLVPVHFFLEKKNPRFVMQQSE